MFIRCVRSQSCGSQSNLLMSSRYLNCTNSIRWSRSWRFPPCPAAVQQWVPTTRLHRFGHRRPWPLRPHIRASGDTIEPWSCRRSNDGRQTMCWTRQQESPRCGIERAGVVFPCTPARRGGYLPRRELQIQDRATTTAGARGGRRQGARPGRVACVRSLTRYLYLGVDVRVDHRPRCRQCQTWHLQCYTYNRHSSVQCLVRAGTRGPVPSSVQLLACIGVASASQCLTGSWLALQWRGPS